MTLSPTQRPMPLPPYLPNPKRDLQLLHSSAAQRRQLLSHRAPQRLDLDVAEGQGSWRQARDIRGQSHKQKEACMSSWVR